MASSWCETKWSQDHLHDLKATEKCPRHHQVELCWNVRIDFPTTKWLQIERGSVLYPYIRDKEMLFWLLEGATDPNKQKDHIPMKKDAL